MTKLRAVRPSPSPARLRRQARGSAARRSGRGAEVLAALWLMARGWRVLAFRLKGREAEIDLLARKGRVLAVVEVKSRATLQAALAAVSPAQQARLRRAGAALTARPGLGGLDVRLDLIALAPRRWPRHVADAWPQSNGCTRYGSGRPP